MKTKPFLLATAGSTVDGRNIDDNMITEMASSYNPKTYGARLNIEHIRGISSEGPFRAYGDVLELSVDEVDVDFNGKSEKRKALFGVFDVTDDAKALNDAGQKMYPSIEIEPNFAGKGFAYMMGCALTDSPASIATERMQFNSRLPGEQIITLSAEKPVAFELAGETSADGNGFLNKLSGLLDGFADKVGGSSKEVVGDTGDRKDGKTRKDTQTPAEKGDGGSRDFSDLRPLFEGLGQTFAQSIGDLRTEMRGEMDRFAVKLKSVEDTIEKTPAASFKQRPLANGQSENYDKVF